LVYCPLAALFALLRWFIPLALVEIGMYFAVCSYECILWNIYLVYMHAFKTINSCGNIIFILCHFELHKLFQACIWLVVTCSVCYNACSHTKMSTRVCKVMAAI
jgi:hypothetical protein